MLRTAAALIAGLLMTTPAIADDFPPGPGTQGVIAPIGGAVAGVFDFAGDVDAFRVTLPRDGRAFAFLLTTACQAKVVKLYNFRMQLIAQSWASTPDQDSVVEWNPRYAGLHYLTVTDIPPPAGYVCQAAASPAYTITSGESCFRWVGTKCTLEGPDATGGGGKLGTLQAVGDRNWYKVIVRPDHQPGAKRRRSIYTYVVGDFAGTTPIITVRAANGAWLTDTVRPATPCEDSSTAACMYVSLCPGTYYVAVRNDAITRPTPYGIELYQNMWDQPGSCP
jgi:hypothetical protein